MYCDEDWYALTGYCDYKGQHYQGGARWDDGCAYTCVCEDAGTVSELLENHLYWST